MSADNWRVCPACADERLQKKRDLSEEIERSYGKVSEKKFLELVDLLNNPIDFEKTLREDFHQGMGEDGVYRVDYKCHCSKCGFYWEYKDKTIAYSFGEL